MHDARDARVTAKSYETENIGGLTEFDSALTIPLVLDFQCHQAGDQDNRKELTRQGFQHHESAGERAYWQDVPETESRECCEAKVAELREGNIAALRGHSERSGV